MPGPKVYFIKAEDNIKDDILCNRLEKMIRSENLMDFIADKDIAAVKTHFGESPKSGYPRPVFLKMIGDLIKERGGVPYLTETSTLYRGNRNNAIKHIAHANSQGFGFDATGMPVIMADGLFGDEEAEIQIKGKIYKSVRIASLFSKCNALVIVSHFTGHLGTGFGAALKNMGMGCSSRRGKMEQHSTAKPSVNKKLCTACGVCGKWCPEDAIGMGDGFAIIDKTKCIGCGQCLAMCRFDAVKYNWGATYEELQKKIVEHAMGLFSLFRDKSIFVNILTRISKDCDCMPSYEKIMPDIGILVSHDPVACDSAALDLAEKTSGKKFNQAAYDIPYRFQLDYSKELKFGSVEYELIEV